MRFAPLVSNSSRCAFMMFMITTLIGPGSYAAQVDGIQVPETLQVLGKKLYLNGSGLRTYSILGIHIYAASLYLEHLSTDPNEVIHSTETKLLTVRFEHAVSAEEAQKAWRTGLANNCIAPCHLDPEDVATFLSQVPAMHTGDNFDLVFTPNGGTVTVNGHEIGTISRRQFADAVLATFLGPDPASPTLKQELLKGHP
jgi:hypothetical protein